MWHPTVTGSRQRILHQDTRFRVSLCVTEGRVLCVTVLVTVRVASVCMIRRRFDQGLITRRGVLPVPS